MRFWQSSLLKRLIQNEIVEERTYFALTLITGVCAGIAAVALLKITHFLTTTFGTLEQFTWRAFGFAAFALIVSAIITKYFPSSGGSGIPGVRLAIAVYNGRMRKRATLAKFLASVTSLSAGISLGREGPTVAISAGIGSFFGHFFSLSKKKVKGLCAIGAAGGIAAAFNTPIAAVVFTLEEVVGDLNAKLLGSIVISAVAAAVTAGMIHGNHATFSELNYHLNDLRELIFYLVIGILAAIIGPLWVKSVLFFRQTRKKLFKTKRILPAIIILFFITGISFINPNVLGSGHEAIDDTLLSLILDWRVLLSLFVLKFLATSICYSSGLSGGLFMPTLLMGAILGALVGSLAKTFFPDITANVGAYALVGMGAYFVSVIRVPFTSIIMVFEMTRDYNIILPLMIANIVAYIIAQNLHHGSVYESISEQDGIHLPTREDHEILEALIVEDAMIREVISLDANSTIKEVMESVRGQEVSGYPITDHGVLVGIISSNEIGANYAKGLKDSKLKEVCTRKVFTIYPDQSLMVAFHRLNQFHVSRLPVVSRINDRQIIGIITAEDIVSKFGFHIQEESKKDVIDKYMTTPESDETTLS